MCLDSKETFKGTYFNFVSVPLKFNAMEDWVEGLGMYKLGIGLFPILILLKELYPDKCGNGIYIGQDTVGFGGNILVCTCSVMRFRDVGKRALGIGADVLVPGKWYVGFVHTLLLKNTFLAQV